MIILAENYVWFFVLGGIFLLITIGYIAEQSNFGKEKISEQTNLDSGNGNAPYTTLEQVNYSNNIYNTPNNVSQTFNFEQSGAKPQPNVNTVNINESFNVEQSGGQIEFNNNPMNAGNYTGVEQEVNVINNNDMFMLNSLSTEMPMPTNDASTVEMTMSNNNNILNTETQEQAPAILDFSASIGASVNNDEYISVDNDQININENQNNIWKF